VLQFIFCISLLIIFDISTIFVFNYMFSCELQRSDFCGFFVAFIYQSHMYVGRKCFFCVTKISKFLSENFVEGN